MANNMTPERMRQEFIAFTGHEPEADIMKALTLIINYVDARRGKGATPYEAWAEVAECMENIAASRGAMC